LIVERAEDWLRRRYRRLRWDRRWRDENAWPAWRIDGVPEVVRDAVEDRWMTEGMRALDVGCGLGYTTAWLAQHGLEVLGVDVSRRAIKQASRLHQGTERLAFDVVDVCQPRTFRRQFDALVDRGCLHQFRDRRMEERYANNVTAWARPGGHFLLLMYLADMTLEARTDQVASLLRSFDLIDVQATSLEGPSAKKPIPGGVFRLVRTRAESR
jgi:2-polyprenyl-3-methyl-5-hydroxy-6-metoxy-1,4-benzoquinol methylase